MGGRTSICRDPARHRELLALLGKKPRTTVSEAADRMALSTTTIRNMVWLLEREGIVGSALDPALRPSPRAGAPRVMWLITPSMRRMATIARTRPKIRPPIALAYPDHPYTPTGTPADRAGLIQVIAVQGPRG